MATGRQLAEELVVDRVRRGYMSISFDTNTHKSVFELGLEVIPCCLLNVHLQPIEHKFSVPVEDDDESFSSGLRESLQKLDLHCLGTREIGNDLIFYHMKDEELLENGDDSSSTLQLHPATQKIKLLMTKIIAKQNINKNYLVQFWAQKIIENKPYLSTSGQPFALGYLGEILNSYRRQCIGHLIFVGEGAKEEELGPPGRVFLTGHLESSPDLRLYTTREFPLLEHVIYCGTREYFSLPLFDLQQNQCFGILEFLGFPFDLRYILEKLKEVKLRPTHVNYHLASMEIDDGRKLALAEIKEMFELLKESPQLHYAFAWMPCCQCADMNVEMFCMERVCDMRMVSFGDWNFQKVNIGKGVTGRVLESKNKICFIENFGGLSILESPWAHCAQAAKLEFCFVVCLQSSRTGDCIYVLEFFISHGSTRFKYPWSYLRFLLCTMRRKLRSFKVASGQQLEADLIYQAIRFGKENDLQSGTVRPGNEADPMANVEEREQDIFDTNFNLRNKRNGSITSLRINKDDLEPHLGKGLEDATNKLGCKCRSFIN